MQAPGWGLFGYFFFWRKPIPKDQWKSKIRLTHLHLHCLKKVPASALRLGLSELLAHLQHHSSKVRRDALRGLLELCRDHPGVLNVSLVEFRFFRFDTFWHRLCHAICENTELFGELASLSANWSCTLEALVMQPWNMWKWLLNNLCPHWFIPKSLEYYECSHWISSTS